MVLQFEVCRFDKRCLEDMFCRVTRDCIVTIHLLPWFPALTVELLIKGRWVGVVGGRFDFCIDYNWFLWFELESGLIK